jgi:thiol-disulfide isomerase/thioredoxin
MLLPEPTYQGPENIVYFRANGLDEELKRDPHVTWIVAFFAPWSPSCINFTPIFAKLSAQYGLPNLKFGEPRASCSAIEL